VNRRTSLSPASKPSFTNRRWGRVHGAVVAGIALLAVAAVLSAAAEQGKPAVEIEFRGNSPRVSAQGPRFETHFAGKPVLVADERGRKLYGESQVDPIELNGPIFVDWPKPDAAMLFTGEQYGYLEPCGCTGLENQKGGLKRRHTLIKQLTADGWPLAMLDSGGHSKGYGPQPKIKLRNSIEALQQMGYQAVGLGENDLRFELLSIAVNLDPNPLTCANVAILEFDAGFSQRYAVVEVGGLKIGVTAVVGERERKALPESDELVHMPADEALAEVLPKLLAEKCDELVLMCYANVDDSKALAAKFPKFNWVVAGKGGDEPPYQPTKLDHGAQLIEVGNKGKYAVVVGLYRNATPTFRYQKVPLDVRFDDSPAMQQRMIDYQQELQTLGFEGLGVKPQAHPSGNKFAGSAACADCHYEEFEIFEKTPHAHATDSIVNASPPRQFDPECISCHVTGWNDPKYVPWISGYESIEKTPHLTHNGCENCHGPAARHVAAENGDIDVSDEEIEALRKALHMEIVENEGNKEGQVEGAVVKNCMECHDLDNSPDFDFQEYWPAVKH
jgi:hypothetical protein